MFAMRDAVMDIWDFDSQHPGVLDGLAELLFPSGLGDLTLAIPGHRILIDFMLGWSILPYAQSIGEMPTPWQVCLCGEGVVLGSEGFWSTLYIYISE
jgi:hypothetical protein